MTAASHLIRGAWIEISNFPEEDQTGTSHLIRGAWIEIIKGFTTGKSSLSRISYEVRGLKSLDTAVGGVPQKSHLIRGAWIEICSVSIVVTLSSSHLIRGAWIEIVTLARVTLYD